MNNLFHISRIICLFITRMENRMQPLEINEEVPFLPKDQSDILFWLSLLIGVTAIYAFHKKQYDAGVLCIIILLTSLNHWRDPKFGFRRNVDMFVVCVGFIYLFVRAIILKINSLLFWICYVAVVLLFPASWYLHNRGHVWLSTFLHCGLHLCGNASVVIFCGS